MTVSLTQVARKAGVSIATASRAINQTGPLAEATRSKVLRVAANLGYVPDPRFRAMGQTRRTRRRLTGNLGLLVPATHQSVFVTDPYYGRLFWSLEEASREMGHHLTLTAIDRKSPDYLPRFVKDLGVDGVLVVMLDNPEFIQRVRSLAPVVMVNAMSPIAGVPCIMPDNRAVVRKAFEYLRSLGHRRVYFFDIHDRPNPHHFERTAAFEDLLLQPGVAAGGARSVVLSERSKPMLETCVDFLRQWRAEGTMPTALLCAADVYALAFLEAAEMLGIPVPGELSVIGVDDLAFCQYARPKLTSVRQPLEDMGRAAIRMLLDLIDHPDGPAPSVMQRYDVEVIVRASCGPARA